MNNHTKMFWFMLFKKLRFMISNKTLIDPKPFRIRFDKIDGFIRIFDGTTITHKIFETNSRFHEK